MTDQSHLSRSGHHALELVHAVIYLTPETGDVLVDLGLEPGRMTYFAGRAAALGAVGPAAVTATFANFNPELIGESIPRAWSLAPPLDIAAARFEGADRVLRRLWGDEIIGSAEVAEAARLAREATAACEPIGRPLYAANAALPWPSAPHLVLWHATTLLREHRGDGHVAALVSAGVSGLEALISHTATGRGFTPKFARTRRGWSDEAWEAAEERLTERGLLDHDKHLAARGQALRSDIEDHTDAMASAPWSRLGDDGAERLREIGNRLSSLIIEGEPKIQKHFAPKSPLFKNRT
ncbi:MAG: SCO6745 family protein [Acidimicrobiales bacterium]